jgi:putative two-component system response regulator
MNPSSSSKLIRNFGQTEFHLDQSIHDAQIFIIDDDPLNIDVLSEILEENGFRNITTATCPEKAVETFGGQSFDLVLLDILMPVMDGFEVMQAFYDIRPNNGVPVVILSALTDQETRLKALNSGARDYISKPFNTAEVLVRIRNQLEIRLAQKQLAMHNEILDRKVRERTAELQETRLEIIHRLGVAAEYRDNETGLHIVRMSQISYELAKAAGMNDREAELVLNASPMHDIGKIGIPDKILLKTDRLNNDEWEIMKTHTTIGAKILTGHSSDLLQSALIIAMTHHERWDGSGYPNGLSRQDIPLIGRIVAIADVFDALTSKRPYKDAWSIERAVSVMEEDSGSHFDPMLIRTFKARLPAILDIKAQYED